MQLFVFIDMIKEDVNWTTLYRRKSMIEFRNVNKTYDTGTEAVHNANFSIEKGEFAFLVGSSGSRKINFN